MSNPYEDYRVVKNGLGEFQVQRVANDARYDVGKGEWTTSEFWAPVVFQKARMVRGEYRYNTTFRTLTKALKALKKRVAADEQRERASEYVVVWEGTREGF